MRHETWKIRGTVSAMGPGNQILVEDEQGRPYLLETTPPLMAYLDDVSDSDLEEKYVPRDFIYTYSCQVLAVMVPGTNPRIPAKAVLHLNLELGLETYGPREILDVDDPDSMPLEEFQQMREAFWAENWNLPREPKDPPMKGNKTVDLEKEET